MLEPFGRTQAVLDPAERHRSAVAMIATLVVVLAIEAVRMAGAVVPSPAAVLFVALVFATIYGGNIAGILSAAAASAYYLWFYELPGPMHMGTVDGIRVALLCLGSFCTVGTIIALRHVLAERERARLVETQRSLSETESRYRQLFNSVRDPVIVYPVSATGEPGQIFAANNAACELYGYSHQEIRQLTVRDIVHPSIDTRGKLQQLLDGKDVITPSIHVAADGRQIPVDVHAHRFELEGRQAVLSIARDVTERERAERELRRERDFSGSILNTIGAAVVVLDREGRVVRCNRAAQQISGYSAQELLGQAVWSRLIPASEMPTVRQTFRELIETGQPNTLRNHWISRDGGTRLMEWSNTVLQGEDGESRYVIGTAIDITDRTAAERELERYRDHLEQRVRDRTAQLADTNQALTEEIAQRSAAEDRLRRAHADLVQAEQRERKRLAEVLHDHLQQLLVAAKMRAQISVKATGRDERELLGFLDEAIAASRSLAVELCPPVLRSDDFLAALRWLGDRMASQQQLNVELAVEGEPRPLDEQVRIFLFESIRELLFNVVKHAQVNQCRVSLKYLPAEVSVTVADEGVGFVVPPDGARASFGHEQVRHRVEMLGGRFWVRSTPGEGAAVTVTVPLHPTPDHAAGGSDAPEGQPGGDGRDEAGDVSVSLRVAIADDHTLFRAGLLQLLEGRPGIRVVGQVGRGDEILDVARELQPDVVLMDVNMPGLSGIEATAAIRQEQPQVRVIGLSMHHEPDVAQRMLAAGAERYLIKDGPPDELIAAIHGRQPTTPQRRLA